jgi:glyoxylase-like metal-dependent hydrolase (beta-lactamase superfamily II)
VELSLPELGASFSVLDIPGHTRAHVAYYRAGALFCGDTLFACGCGKLFEGPAEQMYASLQKLAALPDETKVYCGHEYTLANIRFARGVERVCRDSRLEEQVLAGSDHFSAEDHRDRATRCGTLLALGRVRTRLGLRFAARAPRSRSRTRRSALTRLRAAAAAPGHRAARA